MKNTLAIIAAAVLASSAITYAVVHQNVGDAEFFEMKQRCAAGANAFVEQLRHNGVSGTAWDVLHTAYDAERKSCFAEVDLHAYDYDGASPRFAEYRIYDMFSNQLLDSLTYMQSGSTSEWTEYYKEASGHYYNLRKEIFGLEIGDY